jgi:UDP-N-acetylglucosamine acyltransferase
MQSVHPNAGIHPTAVIHPTACLDPTIEIGPYAVIGEETRLGPHVWIGPHAVIEYAEIGEGCRIHAGAFVGTAPQDLNYAGEKTRLILGPGCVVREGVTLNRGTVASGVTRIGARCFFMAYSHVAHDCVIGDEVVLANSVAIGGHGEVGDWAFVGGLAALHQFARIGKLAMVGGGAIIPLDIPPFTLSWGNRARLSGLNLVGLKRRGYPPDVVQDLKKAYRQIFDPSRLLRDQLASIKREQRSLAVQEFISFIEQSVRGICRPVSKKRSAQDD